MDKTSYALQLNDEINSKINNNDLINKTKPYLITGEGQPNLWEVAKNLGAYYNYNKVDEAVKSFCIQIINQIREYQGQRALTSKKTVTVVFGTSGWRDLIGEGFTFLNVSKVVRSIIDMMKTDTFLKENNYDSFEQVKSAGILLFRDNRYLGDEFIKIAHNELVKEGVKTYNAGECPTGVGSALVRLIKTAGSINFTPSHNPMEYAGLKFNPGDGGPADKNLTKIIEDNARQYMLDDDFLMAEESSLDAEQVNAAEIFGRYIEDFSEVFDIEAIRQWLIEVSDDLNLVIDYMHGSSRGYIEVLLGEEVVAQLKTTGSLIMINVNDDYSFHGIRPEPSAKNQRLLQDVLKKNPRKYNLAIAMDPDADRIRFADVDMDIDMNIFGPLAYTGLIGKGFSGGVASTVASTDFAFRIAKDNSQDFFETAVGFKNFRKILKSGTALVAFEESDGITFKGHTLEKCALAGFLMAIDIMMTNSENLSTVYNKTISQYGRYLPGKGSHDIKGLSVEAWQEYKDMFMNFLQENMFAIGDTIEINSSAMEIIDLVKIDGLKIVFADNSWILLRPSGTEPKFKYYFEVVNDSVSEKEDTLKQAYLVAAEHILKDVSQRLEAN